MKGKLTFSKASIIPMLVLGLLILFSLNSCRNWDNDDDDDQAESFTDLKVDPNFKFETTRELDITINIQSSNPQELPHIITIYGGDPATNLNQMAKGMTNRDRQYKTKISIATYIEEIYVQDYSYDGNNKLVTIPISGDVINYTFTVSKDDPYYKNIEALTDDPGCSSGCTETLTSGGNITLSSGVWCVPEGANVTRGNIKIKGGVTLRICGNLTCSKIQASGNTGGEVIVSTNGTLQTGSIQYNKISPVTNYGYLAESGGNTTIADGCDFDNHGTLAVNGITNDSEEFYNSGTINSSGHFNNNGIGVNDGVINVSGHFNNTGNQNIVFTNNCKIVTTSHFNQSRLFHNYGYISVGAQTQLTGSDKATYMYGGAYIETVDLHVNGNLIGPATSCARIDISNNTTIAGQGDVSGYMDLCDEDGIETNNGTVGPNVTYCECYIPSTSCNPGSGTPTYPDTDGDGVPDDEDDYPDDPTRAFNAYDTTSVAFEDLWPSMGDYDFNDLVLGCTYKIVTNAENSTVDVIAKFKIKAVGASFDNGFGFTFPVAPTTVESVTGYELEGGIVTLAAAGYEAGHLNNTVIIVYDKINTMLGSSLINTVPGKAYIETDTATITVHFEDPQADIGTPPYNPFIFIDHVRGKEVHLIDEVPTSLVNESYFGTLNDNSDPDAGTYYLTNTYLPWAIEIPQNFDYPIEKADIVQTYLRFAEWAESGGISYADWYKDLAGYRNNANIYPTYE